MKRNVVAIIGSAGEISESVRRSAEALGLALADRGFDLVSGGMDGVMRAVARGHGLSQRATNLIHIEPGWGRAWERNPYPAAVVRTELGAMRNHLVVRSADLVVAVAGGAGTLSELAIAWQEGKPVAALRGSGGWSERFADSVLDQRETMPVVGCDTVTEVVDWATRMRPAGVYGGRLNRDFYPLEVPVLHRVHDGIPDDNHRIQLRFGMSIAKTEVVRRLHDLSRQVEDWNREHRASTVALVTFDDGWRDALLLAETFERLPLLCPTIFLSEGHFADPPHPLPLQRLYSYCAKRGCDPEDDVAFGPATRSGLKDMPEAAQHAALDALGVDPMEGTEFLLTAGEIEKLRSVGWVVASHGHLHEYLERRDMLREELEHLSISVERRGHMPWLAWPEGIWSARSWSDARAAGFRIQFGLDPSPVEQQFEGLVMRTVWR